jgi:hypothetical protein
MTRCSPDGLAQAELFPLWADKGEGSGVGATIANLPSDHGGRSGSGELEPCQHLVELAYLSKYVCSARRRPYNHGIWIEPENGGA